MESRLSFSFPRVARFSPLPMNGASTSSSRTLTHDGARLRAPRAVELLALAALALVPAAGRAQQPYASQQYGNNDPYAGQYAQPAPQYRSGQPQYQQPQYGAAQPYAGQPQYADQQPYAGQGYPSEQDLAPPPAAPVQALSAEQLEQMLAPIALYPDALLAQILAASTYPAQVTAADQWLGQMRASGYGSPEQIAAGASAQTTWDPSVKALTAFPDVLDMLSRNLEWTTALGNAYYNQPQDVMETVQMLRQRAEQAGNLQSTPQEDVTNNQGYIDIAPPSPQVVYVPTYDPWDVYGQPIAPYPGFSLTGALGNFFGGLPIQYGLSFALGAFEHTPFGLLAWGLDWLANAILFDHGTWFSHSTTVADWGLPHGGPRAYPGGWRGPVPARGNFDHGYGGTYVFNQRGAWGGNAGRPGRFEQRSGAVAFDSRGNEWARGGEQINRGNQSYNRGPDQFRRGAASFNRGYQPSYNGYTRPENPAYARGPAPSVQAYSRAAPQPALADRPQQSYANPGYGYRLQTYPNHQPTYASRPQTPNFGGYGYGYANRPANGYSGQAYASRPGYGYGSGSSTVRAPQFDSHAHSSRSYSSYGNSFARNESGGFRGFGGEKAPKYRTPKYSYKAPKSFGHESFGHERAPKAPEIGRSGGGGHRHFL